MAEDNEIDPKADQIAADLAQWGETRATFNEIPWFPFSLTLGQSDVTITLHADGKWEGSVEALREALANGKSVGVDGVFRVLLWLILREMERDQRFW